MYNDTGYAGDGPVKTFFLTVSMMRNPAFTLVELMIVIAIIALLSAVSIPILSNMRLQANEASALGIMNTIFKAQSSCVAVESTYANALSNLANAQPPYIDAVLGNGVKNGYQFAISSANAISFVAIGNPQSRGRTGNRSFCVSEGGQILSQINGDYSNTLSNCNGMPIN